MYRWIWRQLPFGLRGKLAGSVLLSAAVVALLWFVIFPWAEPLLPFDDVQVTQESGGSDTSTGGPGVDGTQPSGGTPGDGHDLPYDTDENNRSPASPIPSTTRSR